MLILTWMFFRNFLPDLKEFFEEAIDQVDPESQIEEQYKYGKI